MNTILWILFVFLMWIILAVRNERVYAVRMMAIGKSDFEFLRDVSYDKMMWTLWKSPESFYQTWLNNKKNEK